MLFIFYPQNLILRKIFTFIEILSLALKRFWRPCVNDESSYTMIEINPAEKTNERTNFDQPGNRFLFLSQLDQITRIWSVSPNYSINFINRSTDSRSWNENKFSYLSESITFESCSLLSFYTNNLIIDLRYGFSMGSIHSIRG